MKKYQNARDYCVYQYDTDNADAHVYSYGYGYQYYHHTSEGVGICAHGHPWHNANDTWENPAS